MKLFYNPASREKKKARMAAEMAVAPWAAREEAAREEAARANWRQWNETKELRATEEAKAETEASAEINALANNNDQEIEKIFNEKFNPLKESIAVQFKEISDNIKKDLNNVIEHSKITLKGLNIDLATITINQSLNDADTLLEYLNPKNLVSMLNTYEDQCKTILKKHLGSEVATVTVTKRVGEPEPPNPDTLDFRDHGPFNRYNEDGYRGGGSSKSSKKRKPIKKRRNTKRRM